MPQPELHPVRQVRRIAEDAPLVRRILVKEVDVLAQHLGRRARQHFLDLLQRTQRLRVHVGDVEIHIGHHDVDRRVLHHVGLYRRLPQALLCRFLRLGDLRHHSIECLPQATEIVFFSHLDPDTRIACSHALHTAQQTGQGPGDPAIHQHDEKDRSRDDQHDHHADLLPQRRADSGLGRVERLDHLERSVHLSHPPILHPRPGRIQTLVIPPQPGRGSRISVAEQTLLAQADRPEIADGVALRVDFVVLVQPLLLDLAQYASFQLVRLVVRIAGAELGNPELVPPFPRLRHGRAPGGEHRYRAYHLVQFPLPSPGGELLWSDDSQLPFFGHLLPDRLRH